jgi:Ca2+/Na+ antiporter
VLEPLGIIGNVAVLIVSLAVLIKASSLAITNSVNLASVTGLGKTKIGFILVAFSTSLPELVVVIFSIMKPQTIGISVGNVRFIPNGAIVNSICTRLPSGTFEKSVTTLRFKGHPVYRQLT